jgi:hypothetical protein
MGFNMHDGGWVGGWVSVVSANFEIRRRRNTGMKAETKEDSGNTVQNVKFIVRNKYVK